FETSIERTPRLVRIDAERLDRNRDAGGRGDVARALQSVDDLSPLGVPRDVWLDDADETDQVRLGAEFFRDVDAFLDFCQQRVLCAGFGEAGRPPGVAGADQAHALESRLLLRRDHRLALVGRGVPVAVRLEPFRGDGTDAIRARHRWVAA